MYLRDSSERGAVFAPTHFHHHCLAHYYDVKHITEPAPGALVPLHENLPCLPAAVIHPIPRVRKITHELKLIDKAPRTKQMDKLCHFSKSLS